MSCTICGYGFPIADGDAVTLDFEKAKEFLKKHIGSFGQTDEEMQILDALEHAESEDTEEDELEDVIMQNDACHKEWDKILDRMIFLWRELDEETCSEKNKYEKEYSKASDEFFDKYGFFGEGLETEEEKEKAKKTGSRRVHFMSELPEYEEISRLHMEEEKRLVEYREKCKDEVFDLMKKYFFALWD